MGWDFRNVLPTESRAWWEGWGKKNNQNFSAERSAWPVVRITIAQRVMSSIHHCQAQEPDPDPSQFAEPPQQREGDAGDVGITKGSQQGQIPSVLGAEAAGNQSGQRTWQKQGLSLQRRPALRYGEQSCDLSAL